MTCSSTNTSSSARDLASQAHPTLASSGRDQSCRSVLDALNDRGELVVIDHEVDAKFDVSAMLSLVDGAAAVRMNNVRGYDMPVFGNILSSVARVALVLGVDEKDVQSTILRSVQQPLAPEVVENAPVQEVVVEKDILTSLPAPYFFSKESGAYISAGLLIAKDPETGKGNASYARLKVLGPDRAMIGIAPNHHLAIMARKAADNGKPLEYAVVLGAHPAIQLAACLYLDLGQDEMHTAGGLLGEPLRVARCKTIDLEVPAEAEIVLEGKIYPDELIKEGPVSEYHGMYEDYGNGVLTTFSCMTHRKDAMLQVIEPGYHMEHIYIAGVSIAASLKYRLSGIMQNIGEIAVTASGCGRNNVVVQVHKPKPGQARRIMSLCWGAVSIIKNVTIVDSDVDPWDLEAVELAKMTRMRAERDILIVTDMPADRSEPQEASSIVAKIGYDATCRPQDRGQGYDKALPPEEAYERMRTVLKEVRPDLV